MIHFYKYHGAGNDFILIDDRAGNFDIADVELVAHLCDRHFGIGADGLMLVRNHEKFDFEMVYFNSDGRQSSMCGNGGRCIVAFAHKLGIVDKQCSFLAIDGMHKAIIRSEFEVSLEMIDVQSVESINENAVLLDTGSPHYIEKKSNLDVIDLISEAKKIRYNERFKEEGVNVNFVEWQGEVLHIRTYERGVENETLACGTGVTAAAIAMNFWNEAESEVEVKALGGDLKVTFNRSDQGVYQNVWKTGPVQLVFEGDWLR